MKKRELKKDSINFFKHYKIQPFCEYTNYNSIKLIGRRAADICDWSVFQKLIFTLFLLFMRWSGGGEREKHTHTNYIKAD